MPGPLLPLLAPKANANQRRHRSLQWIDLCRYLARRRLRVYLIALALILILAITILHKYNLEKEHLETRRQYELNHARFEARTIKTIIGKYVGPKPSWASEINIQNLSTDILNTNNYDPSPDIGRDGRPAYLPGYPKDQMKVLFAINRFNLVASDKISVDRKLPDPRKMACRKKKFNTHELPKTSVIVVFHNEAWSTLARTVHSILNTAPQHLLTEILLVDDASNRTFLGKSLDYYMNNLGSVRGVDIIVLRSKERVGLIKSRLIGVKQARGEVLTFIDAHCEATTGWLEPLLEQIKLNRKVAACPIIDIINEDTFAFTRSFELHLGAINWGLNFRWYPISRRELVASNGYSKPDGKVKITELIHPFHTPVMAGGLFSIEKDYFNEMGAYDPHMDIWGGENIELSLRLWQCGGEVKIVPCSHVAHIFRKSSPYTFRPGKEVGDILYSNLARVSEVWMDEWSEFFYLMNPIVNRTLAKVGREQALSNIEARKELRKNLKCKNFRWFLDNVWPENFFPSHDRFFGRIKHVAGDKCLRRPQIRVGQAAVGAVETYTCSSRLNPSQLFVFNPTKGFIMTDENVCLDTGSDPVPSRQVILAPCNESVRQKWNLTHDSHLQHINSKLCLDVTSYSKVQLELCNKTDQESLKWSMLDVNWH